MKGTKLEIDFSELKKLIEKLPEMVAEKNNEREEWSLKIVRVDNGYELTGSGDPLSRVGMVREDLETDQLKSCEQLLWDVMNYFNFGGTKHDPERLRIVRQKNK